MSILYSLSPPASGTIPRNATVSDIEGALDTITYSGIQVEPNGWNGSTAQPGLQLLEPPDPALAGSRAFRFEVEPGDDSGSTSGERGEIHTHWQIANSNTGKAGNVAYDGLVGYFECEFLIPADANLGDAAPDSSIVVHQVHSNNGSDEPFSVFLDNKGSGSQTWRLRIQLAPDLGGGWYTLAYLGESPPTSRRIQVQAEVRYSTGSSGGVSIRYRNVPFGTPRGSEGAWLAPVVTPPSNTIQSLGTQPGDSENYHKMGAYVTGKVTQGPGPVRIWHTYNVMATTAAERTSFVEGQTSSSGLIVVTPSDDAVALFASAQPGDVIELQAATPGGSGTIVVEDQDLDVTASGVTVREREGDTVTLEVRSTTTSEVRIEIKANDVTFQASTPCSRSGPGGLLLRGNRMRLVVSADRFTMRGVDLSNGGTNFGVSVGWSGSATRDGVEIDACRIHDVGRYTAGASPSHCLYVENASNLHVHDSYLWNADDRAIQLSPYSVNGVFERNVIHNCLQGMHGGNGQESFGECREPLNNVFRDNICSNTRAFSSYWGYDVCSATPTAPGEHMKSYDTVAFRNDGGSLFDLDPASAWSYSVGGAALVLSSSPQAGTHYLALDPEFVDPDNGDFTPQSIAALGYGPADLYSIPSNVGKQIGSSNVGPYVTVPRLAHTGVQSLAGEQFRGAIHNQDPASFLNDDSVPTDGSEVWERADLDGSSTLAIVDDDTGRLFAGSYARHVADTVGGRAELKEDAGETTDATHGTPLGSTTYFAFSFRYPNALPSPAGDYWGHLIFQRKCVISNVKAIPPQIALIAESANGGPGLYLRTIGGEWDARSTDRVAVIDPVPGEWYDVVIGVHQQSSTTGWAKAWVAKAGEELPGEASPTAELLNVATSYKNTDPDWMTYPDEPLNFGRVGPYQGTTGAPGDLEVHTTGYRRFDNFASAKLGLHHRASAMTQVASLTTTADNQRVIGTKVTGGTNVRHANVRFVDFQSEGSVNVQVQDYPSASAVFAWSQFGRTSGPPNSSNPALRGGNARVWRSESCGYIDLAQMQLGVFEMVECWLHDIYDGEDDYFGGGPQSAHPDPIQFNFYRAEQQSPAENLRDVIIQGCRFDTWVLATGDVVGETWGVLGTAGIGTSGAFIMNPKDPYLGPDGVTFRDNYVDGDYHRILYITCDSPSSAPKNAAVIDNIFKKRRPLYGDLGVASIHGDATLDVAWGRNLDADTGAEVASGTNNTSPAGESSLYPSSTLFTGETGGAGGGEPPQPVARPTFVGTADADNDGGGTGIYQPPAPAGLQVGDLVIVTEQSVVYGTNSRPKTFQAAPAGWAAEGELLRLPTTANTRAIRSRVLWKTWEQGDVMPTLQLNNDAVNPGATLGRAKAVAYRDHNPDAPFEAGWVSTGHGAGGTLTGAALTSGGAGRLAVASSSVADDESHSGASWSNLTGAVERADDTAGSGADGTIAFFDAPVDEGSTGDFSVVMTGDDASVVHVAILRPSSAVLVPDPVSNFSALGGDQQVDLSWNAPATSEEVIVRSSTSGYPTSESDGTLVYQGVAGTHSDTGLTNDQQVFYAAFSMEGGVASAPAYATAIPTNSTPPAAPGSVTATADGHDAGRTSAVMPSAEVAEYRIMVKQGAGQSFADPNDGTLVRDWTPAANDEAIDNALIPNLAPATTYSVAWWARNDSFLPSLTAGTAELTTDAEPVAPPPSSGDLPEGPSLPWETCGADGTIGREIAEAMDPMLWADPEHGEALRRYLCAVGLPFEMAAYLVREHDQGEGWTRALDPNLAPDAILPWTAQFYGVPATGLSAGVIRRSILQLHRRRRGTKGRIEEVVRAYLNPQDTEKVAVVERVNGNAYHLGIATDPAERVDDTAMQRDVRRLVPAGMTVTFTSWTSWIAIAGGYATWDAVVAGFTDWQAVAEG